MDLRLVLVSIFASAVALAILPIAAADTLVVKPQDQSAALEAIRSAELQGKDTSGMVANYNSAVNLLKQYSPSYEGTCSSSASCEQLQHAENLFHGISNGTSEAGPSTAAAPANKAVVIFGAALGAIVGSFVIILIYRVWKGTLDRRFLKTELRRKLE